jgi:hypothetical protein
MRKTVLILVLAMAALLGCKTSDEQQSAEGTAPRSEFALGPRYAYMPEKFFLLIRKGQQIGAIHFTKIRLGADGNGESSYESYFQADGSMSFQRADVVKQVGEIEIKPLRGNHVFAWQPGQNKLRVGKWWFGCMSPNLVNMSEHFSEDDTGFEFAPTSAETVEGIDALDKRLRWYRYDSEASITVTPSGLPK